MRYVHKLASSPKVCVTDGKPSSQMELLLEMLWSSYGVLKIGRKELRVLLHYEQISMHHAKLPPQWQAEVELQCLPGRA